MHSALDKALECCEPIAAHERNYIIIPKSTFELSVSPENSWVLIEIIVNWVENSFEKSDEFYENIPTRALQLYFANHYYSLVQIEGHRNFLISSSNCAGQLWPYILAGLLTMGAHEHAYLFQEMADWASNNPKEVAKLTDDDTHFELLSSLDKKFENIEGTNPFNEYASIWINSWPELMIMDDDEFKKEALST